MSKNDDSLFLLEVLIDKIVFVKSPCFSDKDFRTCVNIECNGVEPLEVCDDDPNVGIASSGGPFVKQFNTGKSCLFSLKESDISAAMSKFPVKVTVYKSLPCGCLPTKIVMGECTIDMTKEFVETRKNFLEDPSSVSYQALKDSFRFVGPDGDETGEIVMFLRISCFGKLIITSFQGASGGAPSLGGKAGGSSGIVDRSCTPKKDFQSTEDPCVCGAARGHGGAGGSGGYTCTGGGGVCPPARDPYNTMPCIDPDDPCYCSGPKPAEKQNMACRNTDQYCLHVPKGVLSSSLFYQELNDEQINKLLAKSSVELPLDKCNKLMKVYNNVILLPSCENSVLKTLKMSAPMKLLSEEPSRSYTNLNLSYSSLTSTCYERNTEACYPRSSYNSFGTGNYCETESAFGARETAVYMTLFDEYCPSKCSGTQATALINKCFQVRSDNNSYDMNSDQYSNYTMSTVPPQDSRSVRYVTGAMNYSEVYFFGRKKEPEKGMGGKESKTRLCKTGKPPSAPSKSTATKTTRSKDQSTCSSQTKRKLGANTSTGTYKSVTIKDDKPEKPCPAVSASKGEMMATVSHIKIGPKEPCPVHGKDPCQGPKCIVASSGESSAPVKVTTVTNARRGVFELVIRRITGAPLAKNELLLEWTPPPSRPPPCGSPCPIPCTFPGPCRPSKCKLIVCKPSPCRPKCCKKKPCGQPCRPPCKKCCKVSCCGKPCSSCIPFPPPPCKKPCTPPCCRLPCKSSPCLKPCPIGRKRPRKSKSQPKIKAHKKHQSPCNNRVKACPVVKCRSMPGCCAIPLPCPPRKCCSVAPCKPPKCCRSNCSSCCGS
ncbi:uncharacterized protein LOC111001128 isoform X2 [Pieris rapae]|uniref:uncharacterized protein LOC111001128 isoform X2 n=1 Tax=Pieris rapae TaxID=64459 RepID=UPI001E2812E8|nr:uncharacterized protein LOC111001128 isoform X2 [Pieris rapae]